jgi:predicted PurR-regulated permease PerM
MFDIFKKYITVKNIIFFVISVLTIIFITKIKDIAIMFFASYVIACSMNPIVDKLEGKIKRPIASGLVLLGSLLLASIFFIPIFVIVASQIKTFIERIPEYYTTIHTIIVNNAFLNNTIFSKSTIGSLLSSSVDMTTKIVNSSIGVGMNIASQFVYFIAACLIIYYFMADRDKVRKGYLKLFPKPMKNKADLIL